MRQSNEMVCEDNLSLVLAVKSHPCLYNFNLPEYLKKEETEVAWNEVAKSMGSTTTVHECKEKWRNLRYSLLRSLKPNADGSAKKKYYLHKELEFLLPFIKTKYQFEAHNSSQFDEDSDDESNTVKHSNAEDTIVGEEQTNNLEYCNLEYAEPLPKRRKITHRPTRDGNTECPRKMFLYSLLPEIINLTEVQMKAFRRNIFKLIDDISQIGERDIDIDIDAKELDSSMGDFVAIIKPEPV